MSLVVITGASSGIGESLAQRLDQRADLELILLGRNLNALKHLQAELKGSHHILSADLNVPAEIEKVVQSIKEISQDRGLKALVNNAGVFDLISFEESSDELWERQISTNLMAPVKLTRGLYTELLKGEHSAVINISSTLAQRPLKNVSAYAAIKAALDHWSRCLALEWAPGIRVNVVAPGIIDTPIHSFHRNEDESGKKMADQMQPMKRIGRPDEIAAMVEYLIFENAHWITGSTFNVDGGVTLA